VLKKGNPQTEREQILKDPKTISAKKPVITTIKAKQTQITKSTSLHRMEKGPFLLQEQQHQKSAKDNISRIQK
jgi:hypothetical protein